MWPAPAMSRRLTVQQAAARPGMSERSAYRDLAPPLGREVGGKWEIDKKNWKHGYVSGVDPKTCAVASRAAASLER